MELIKGNLLFIIAMVEMAAYMFFFGQYSDTAFVSEFLFYRSELMRREFRLMGKIILIEGILGIGLYYLIEYLLGGNYVSAWYMFYLFLIPFLGHSSLVVAARKNNVGGFVAIISLLSLSCPAIVLVCMLWKHLLLDYYCGIFTVILMIVDGMLGKKMIASWKRGDM